MTNRLRQEEHPKLERRQTELDEEDEQGEEDGGGIISGCEVRRCSGGRRKRGGMSGNTTVMVRHIPGKCTQQKLMREINTAGFLGKFDFINLSARCGRWVMAESTMTGTNLSCMSSCFT